MLSRGYCIMLKDYDFNDYKRFFDYRGSLDELEEAAWDFFSDFLGEDVVRCACYLEGLNLGTFESLSRIYLGGSFEWFCSSFDVQEVES